MKRPLQSWGIRTCAELAALAETDLIARLGQAGKRLHALACGDMAAPDVSDRAEFRRRVWWNAWNWTFR